MRGDRTTRTDMPYDAAQGYDQGYGAEGGYGNGQPAGFNRHTSSNARRVAAQNPLKDGARKLGGAVAGLGRSAVAKIPHPEPKRPHASVSYDEGDFLGTGSPCRACGNPIDSSQARCPHCGAYAKPLYQSIPFWILVVVALALVVLLSLAINSCRSTQAPGPGPAVNPGSVSQDGDPATTPAPADKSALQAAVSSAQVTLDAQAAAHTYTAYSANALQAAVNTANQVLSNAAASDEEVSNAATAVSDAMAHLVTPLSDADYPWPDYGDLVANLGAYVGQQVAVNGTTQSVSTDDATGLTTAIMAIAGDPNNLVYVQYGPGVADGEVEVAVDFTAMGTVSGSQDGYPVVLADRIQIM